jgi:oxygen-independent coproporphyrinogen-3 oxidase
MQTVDSQSELSGLSLPPLSLYIHIPWCVKKCPYCDFNSHVNSSETEELPEDSYIEFLTKDLQQHLGWVQGRRLHSIFFGGGTPSLFSAQSIASILNMAEGLIGFEDDIEITLEANPGTFEQQKFSGYFKAGVNRLSIGVQSFQEKHLQKLGRIHNQDEAIAAINMAKRAGFGNINIDLMHGLPGQSLGDALNDLETAIKLSPQHVSWYQLTIEPNTVFYRQPPILPVEDVLADIQHEGLRFLKENGFYQYEVSAFSKPDFKSQHNLNYWQFGDYIGIGAGAHGKNTAIQQQQIIRCNKTRLPRDYMSLATAPNYKEVCVSHKEAAMEFFMNALRLNGGFMKSAFENRTGLKMALWEKPLSKLIQQGLLEDSRQIIKPTPLGHRFLNAVLTQLMEHS